MSAEGKTPKDSLPIVLWIFGGVGVVLIAAAAWIVQSRQAFIAGAERAPGTVIGFEKRATSHRTGTGGSLPSYAPIVRFETADGRGVTFAADAAGTGSDLKKGDPVGVYYDPAEPGRAKIDTFFHLWVAALVVGGLGVLFAGIPLVVAIVQIAVRARRNRLLRDGARVRAVVVSVVVDGTRTVGGRNPVRIHASWTHPTTGRTEVIRSHPVWEDLPSDVEGRSVDVYVDRKRPDRFFLDPGSLRS